MPSHSLGAENPRGHHAGLSNPYQAPATRRWEAATFALVVAGAAALRLLNMSAPVWLDEAWVANSVLEPTLKETLFFDQWVQTTPPLLLVLLRWAVAVLGTGEAALRAVPWLSGVAAVACFAVIARRIFSWPLSLLGTTLLAANYYAAKYAQQAKQYSTDLLVACLLLLCLWRLQKSGGNWKDYGWLALLGAAGVFLSYPGLFWLPAALVAIAMQTRPWERSGKGSTKSWLARQAPLLVISLVYMAVSFVLYFLFIAQNQSPELLNWWRDQHLGSAGRGLGDVLTNVSVMMVPELGRQAAIRFVIGGLIVLGALRAVWRGARGDVRGRWIVVVCVLPIVAGLMASVAQRYPLLDYPRLVLWMLPCVSVLMVFAVEPVWQRLRGLRGARSAAWVESVLVPAACLAAMIGHVWVVSRHTQAAEEVREAASYLRERVGTQDGAYVHALVDQAFKYYERRWSWYPAGVYFGSIASPCCRLYPQLQFSSPGAATLDEDLREYVARTRSGTAWAISPSGSDPNHFTYGRRIYYLRIPEVMESLGCRQTESKEFRHVRIWAFACGTASPQTIP